MSSLAGGRRVHVKLPAPAAGFNRLRGIDRPLPKGTLRAGSAERERKGYLLRSRVRRSTRSVGGCQCDARKRLAKPKTSQDRPRPPTGGLGFCKAFWPISTQDRPRPPTPTRVPGHPKHDPTVRRVLYRCPVFQLSVRPILVGPVSNLSWLDRLETGPTKPPAVEPEPRSRYNTYEASGGRKPPVKPNRCPVL